MRSSVAGRAPAAPGARCWAVAVLALVAAGCGPDGHAASAPPVPDSVYVEVMARLVLLDSLMGSGSRHLPEGTSRDSARASVLRAHGVAGDELLAFARERGTRPERMEAIWRRIYELSDSLGDEGWRPPVPGADRPGPVPAPGRDTSP